MHLLSHLNHMCLLLWNGATHTKIDDAHLTFHMLEFSNCKTQKWRWSLPNSIIPRSLTPCDNWSPGESTYQQKAQTGYILTEDLGTFPRIVMYRLAFSLATRIICLGAIVERCGWDDFVGIKLNQESVRGRSEIGYLTGLDKWQKDDRAQLADL